MNKQFNSVQIIYSQTISFVNTWHNWNQFYAICFYKELVFLSFSSFNQHFEFFRIVDVISEANYIVTHSIKSLIWVFSFKRLKKSTVKHKNLYNDTSVKSLKINKFELIYSTT